VLGTIRATFAFAGVRRRVRRSIVFAVSLLALGVALGGAMPAWARLAFGPAAHACKCEVSGGHAHCACPLCFPELRDDDLVTASVEKVTGRCGTDDPGWRTLAFAAVPGSAFVVSPPLARIDLPAPFVFAPSRGAGPPEPPPPRGSLSRSA